MSMENVAVAELMSDTVITATPGTPVTDAADVLLEHGVGSLVVVGESGEVVGMLTSTDLVAIVSAGTPPTDATVAQYMSDDVVTVAADASVRAAAAKMITNAIQHLPVVDDAGDTVGMLSATDLTGYLSYSDRGEN